MALGIDTPLEARCKCDKAQGSPLCATCPARAFTTTFPVEHVREMRAWLKEQRAKSPARDVVDRNGPGVTSLTRKATTPRPVQSIYDGHDDAFAAFRARREAERAAAVKVTWRKVSPMTGGGWSALGPAGALGFVAPRDPEHGDYAWGDLNQDVRPWRRNVVGRELTLARAKAAVEQMFVE